MKKGIKKYVVILVVIITLLLLFFLVDWARAQKGELPIFCIKIQSYRDGGSSEYLGLGYKVIDYATLEGYNATKIGSWFMRYEVPESEKEVTYFYGKIQQINGNFVLIKAEEDQEITKLADLIATSFQKVSPDGFKVGDKVKVYYTGVVRETYPAGVDCITIEKIE